MFSQLSSRKSSFNPERLRYQKVDYHHPVNLSLLMRFCTNLPPEQKPLIPFILIESLAKNKLESLYGDAISQLAHLLKDQRDRNLITSCLNTSYIVSVIFFGEDHAKKMITKLLNRVKFETSIGLPSGGTLRFETSSLFDGEIISARNHDKSGIVKKTESYVGASYQSFFASLQAKLQNSYDDATIIKTLNNYLTYNLFDFNTSTLQALKSEINRNHAMISQNQSCVYCVGIAADVDFKHVFMIEQFYLHDEQAVCYHIYQSWIDHLTLNDDIKKRQYRADGKGAMSQAEFNDFFDTFAEFYSKNNHDYRKNASVFGYPHLEEKPIFTNFDGFVLSGVSVRYFSVFVDPENSLKNLKDFINKNTSANKFGR